MSTQAVTPQIEGLPPGAVVTPLSGGAAAPIEGLPPGATITPIGPPQPADDAVPTPHESMLSEAVHGVANLWPNLITGAGREVARTVAGISKLDPSVPQIPQVQNFADAPQENLTQQAGGLYENILEFMMGDEALKGLSLGEKLTKIAPVLKIAEKFPNVAKALSGAARTGVVSGAQAGIKTGDPEQALEAAGAGAVAGGVLEGGAGKLSDLIKEHSPIETEVGGQKFVTPRAAEVPPEVQKAQTAGKNVITQSAKSATENNVLGETRPLNHPGRLEGIPATDVPAAVARVQSFGDAADEVEKSAKTAYDNLNQATGGKFSEVRDSFNLARKEVYRAGSVGERDAAQIRLDNATARMRQLFDEAGGTINQADWKNANAAWNNAKTLRQVHDAVESTFDTDAGFSQRSGTYRGFNGNLLRQRLNRLTQTIGEPELNRVIGRDNMDNLRKVAELTRTNADRAKFGAAVQKVGGWLARESTAAGAGALVGHFTGLGGLGGAVGGEAAYMAARKVMQAVATNPKVGQYLTFAIESGARPEIYAPILGQMIRDQQEQQPSE